MKWILAFLVPVAVAAGTFAIWNSVRLAPREVPLAIVLAFCIVIAQRYTAVRWRLGAGYSVGGTLQAASWTLVGAWSAVLGGAVAALVSSGSRRPSVRIANAATFVLVTSLGYGCFRVLGGANADSADSPLMDIAVPVFFGSACQLAFNIVIVGVNVAKLRSHRLIAALREVTTGHQLTVVNQVVGAVLLASLAWAVTPHGVGLILGSVPLLVHVAAMRATQDLEIAQGRTLNTLSRAAETRDPYLERHGDRVSRYAQAIGRAMRLGPSHIESLDLAGRLHDVGFVAPAAPDEQIRDHPARGADMLTGLTFLTGAAEIVRQHHERPDGRGYPIGEGSLPNQGARILAVADSLDAVVGRSGPQIFLPEALAILRAEPGRFDPEVVDALERANPALERAPEGRRPPWWEHDLPEFCAMGSSPRSALGEQAP